MRNGSIDNYCALRTIDRCQMEYSVIVPERENAQIDGDLHFGWPLHCIMRY